MQISPPQRKKKKTFSSMNESDIKLGSVLNSLSYMQKKIKHFHYTLAQHFLPLEKEVWYCSMFILGHQELGYSPSKL